MTIAVDLGRKATKTNKTELLCIKIMQPVAITLFFHLMLLLFSGIYHVKKGAQRLSGRVLDSRLRVQDSPASLRRGP